MDLICADDALRLKRIEQLYLRTFPKNERKPFGVIGQKKNEGITDILSIEENGEFLGLAITINYQDKVLLDYFAMDDAKRGKGYGSAALAALMERYDGRRIILEIESTTRPRKAGNFEERLRRKHFYHKNGMTDLGFEAVLFGVTMEMLSNKTQVTFEEYLDLYVKTYGKRMLECVTPLTQTQS